MPRPQPNVALVWELNVNLCPLKQHGFDLAFLVTGGHFLISPSRSEIERSVVIGMILIAADHTAERLLIGSIGTVHIATP